MAEDVSRTPDRGARLPQSRLRLACGRYGIGLALLPAISLLLVPSSAAAHSLLKKDVLIINQVGLSHRIYATVTEEIQSRLTDSPDYQVEFYSESLDSMSLTDESLQREIQAQLVHKYRNVRLDAIVAIGPEPTRFLSGPAAKLLPEVPVVLCGGIEGLSEQPARFPLHGLVAQT